MPFNSLPFIFFFLPIVLGLYYISPQKMRNILFLGLSLLFYTWGEMGYVVILLISIGVNYLFGLLIDSVRVTPRQARAAAFLGVAFNLILLATFKYLNVIVIDKLNPLPLPLGISFFTFQAVAYLIDIYRGTIKGEKNLVNFGLFIAIFPQLLAGPIIRYQQFADQLTHRQYTRERFANGIRRFSIGLAKKILIANKLAVVADQIFALNSHLVGMDLAWLAILCYSFQILYDFSGYTDMALGLGVMFGFTLPENFNYPYAASSLREFWQRWHMTLSNWLRDYLFFPLSRALLKRYGRQYSGAIQFVSYMTIMIVCGVWHGLGMGFLMWGIWHGLGIFVNSQEFTLRRRFHMPVLPQALGIIMTFTFVTLGWVFFRLETLPQALDFFMKMVSFRASDPAYPIALLVNHETRLAVFAAVICSMPLATMIHARFQTSIDHRSQTLKFIYESVVSGASLCFYSGLFVLSLMAMIASSYTPFLYFRF